MLPYCRQLTLSSEVLNGFEDGPVVSLTLTGYSTHEGLCMMKLLSVLIVVFYRCL